MMNATSTGSQVMTRPQTNAGTRRCARMGLRQYCGSRQRPEHHQRTGHSDGPAAFDRAYVRALREFRDADDLRRLAKICEQESQQISAGSSISGCVPTAFSRTDCFPTLPGEAGIDQCQVKVKMPRHTKDASPRHGRVRGRYASNRNPPIDGLMSVS